MVARRNDNRARAKAGRTRTVPASVELMRLYSDYLHREYGVLDSDYVFVNLFAEQHGHPWAYPAVSAARRRSSRWRKVPVVTSSAPSTVSWRFLPGEGHVKAHCLRRPQLPLRARLLEIRSAVCSRVPTELGKAPGPCRALSA